MEERELRAEAKLRVISVDLELIPEKSYPFQRFEINLKAVWNVQKGKCGCEADKV